jgi:hypothetical protein
MSRYRLGEVGTLGHYLEDGFQLLGIENPHKCYAFDIRGLPGLPCLAPLIVRSVSKPCPCNDAMQIQTPSSR